MAQAQQYVTRSILKRELSAVERRLDVKIDSKIDTAVQTMKEYTDSRFTQLDTKFGRRFDAVDLRFEAIDQRFEAVDRRFNKMDGYFEQLVGMVLQQGKKIDKVLALVQNHERRITALEH